VRSRQHARHRHRTLADGLVETDITQVIHDADPRDKAEIYS
jgi:hypothetical protein